jgi:ribosomal protein S18 acetylase RimI-like enzyme
MAKITSRVLETADEETAAALAVLLPQVSSRAAPLTLERVEAVVSSPATSIVVASLDERIVGMALLCVCQTLAGRFGLVEEVAVDEAARGHHVGIGVMVSVLERAQVLGLDYVELTSRPSREAANGLYLSLGFELRETNVYRHRLETMPTRR